jgi:hypothetical protein
MLLQLRSTLDQYCGFEVSGVDGLFPREEHEVFAVESRWPETYPNASRRGVYLIFGKSGRLLYLGKASQQAMGNRLGTYFHYDENKGCRVIHTGWSETPSYVITIAVHDNRWFESVRVKRIFDCCAKAV